jgi:hypothetical protein
MNNPNPIVPFDKNSYIAFDGLSIRDIIVNRLNQSQIFTDQNYQGSNLSALIDIISYTFSNLLYYLNKTSAESMFSEAQVYENMNRIVKILNYKPVGRLGQNLPFKLIATDSLPIGSYFIPRYSYITVGNTSYSLNQDIVFSKTINGQSQIEDVNNNYLLYQGLFKEYPTYTALGIADEVLFLALNESTYIDHFNIFVYVKPANSTTWEQWSNVTEMFLHGSDEPIYTTRFNENLIYEITFGNGINGKQLNPGDQVAVYYLSIDPNAKPLAPNSIDYKAIIQYNTQQYNKILLDTSYNYEQKLNPAQFNTIALLNDYPSNSYSDYETVDMIREKAPLVFKSQNRLVTVTDYENYVKINYSNIISDVKVVNNDDYLRGHIKYLYNIGLNSPQTQTQILYNQIKFANSCNFNNIYVYTTPNNYLQDYLLPPQKELILNDLKNTKTITTNIVMMDPVYMYLDFYTRSPITDPTIDDLSKSVLRIIKSPTTKRSSAAILTDVKTIFNSYFNNTVNRLDQLIDLYQIASDILSLDGVKNIQTYRYDTDTSIKGISVLMWNNLYPYQDATVHTQNINLEYFQYPVFNNIENITSRIEVVDVNGSVKPVDF